MKNLKAFTLVELIVVITILAVLGTIAFISFQSYTKFARNSIRATDLQSLSHMLAVRISSSGYVPIPSNKVDITASGVLISYQGDIDKEIASKINVSGKLTDPLTNLPYSYATNRYFTKYQVLGFMEGEDASNGIGGNVYAGEEEKIIKTSGLNVGIIFDSTNNPINYTGTGVDVVTTNNEYTAYFDTATELTGTGLQLQFLQLPLFYESSEDVNLIGDQSLGRVNGTFNDGTLNNFTLYNYNYGACNSNGSCGGVPPFEPVVNKVITEGGYNGGESLYVKNSNIPVGSWYDGGTHTTITNNSLYFQGVEYSFSYKLRKISDAVSWVHFSVQNGSGDQNCLSHTALSVPSEWKTYKRSCSLDIKKGHIYIWTNQASTEFMLDDVKLMPTFLENYQWNNYGK